MGAAAFRRMQAAAVPGDDGRAPSTGNDRRHVEIPAHGVVSPKH
jgi:hypothetical protein